LLVKFNNVKTIPALQSLFCTGSNIYAIQLLAFGERRVREWDSVVVLAVDLAASPSLTPDVLADGRADLRDDEGVNSPSPTFKRLQADGGAQRLIVDADGDCLATDLRIAVVEVFPAAFSAFTRPVVLAKGEEVFTTWAEKELHDCFSSFINSSEKSIVAILRVHVCQTNCPSGSKPGGPWRQ
jgi:hypothetical protein